MLILNTNHTNHTIIFAAEAFVAMQIVKRFFVNLLNCYY